MFMTGGAVLDFAVLGILKNGDEYGYLLTRKVKKILDISETAMYPALKRLEKSGCLTTYDVPFKGRIRRYYKISGEGLKLLDTFTEEWQKFKKEMDLILEGEIK